jgi:hypothetical protein
MLSKRIFWLTCAAVAIWLIWMRLRQRQDEFATNTPQFAPPRTFVPPPPAAAPRAHEACVTCSSLFLPHCTIRWTMLICNLVVAYYQDRSGLRKVSRKLVDKNKITQGGNQVHTFEYRISVNNYKAEPIRLQVWDRLPHPENDNVGVSLIRTAPEVCRDAVYIREQRPNNLLRWDLKIEPSMNGEKAYARISGVLAREIATALHAAAVFSG